MVVAVAIGLSGFHAGASSQASTIRLCDIVSDGPERARWVDAPEDVALELLLLGAYTEGEGQCPPDRPAEKALPPGAPKVCAERSTICHVPEGSPAAARRVTAEMPELEAHLKHPDDSLIGCGLPSAEIAAIDCGALALGKGKDGGDDPDAMESIESNGASKTDITVDDHPKPVGASVARGSGGGMGASRGAVSFTICDHRVGETGRVIDVNAIGRIDISRHGCD